MIRWWAAGLVALVVSTGSPRAMANGKSGPIIHKVATDGETYAAIADHYYGKRYLERHLRLFNRKPEPLKKNTTILIPTFRYIAAKPGQTVADFAKIYLNDEGRAAYVAAAHGLKKARLTGRQRLKVVQSLGHVVHPGESLKSIAQTYYREATPTRLKLLKLYNKLESARLEVGTKLRIPLDGKEFSQRRVAQRATVPFDPTKSQVNTQIAKAPERPAPLENGKGRTKSGKKERRERRIADTARTEQNLESAERLYDEGRYDACADLTKEALREQNDAPVALRIEMLRVSAFTLIALGRYPESRDRFRDLLELDPKYELDLYRTSPKILDIFQSVFER